MSPDTLKKLSKIRLTTVGLVIEKQPTPRTSIGIEHNLKAMLKKLKETQEPGDHLVYLKSFDRPGGSFKLFEPEAEGRHLVEVQDRDEVRRILVKERFVFRLRMGQMLSFTWRDHVVRISNSATAKGSIIETLVSSKAENISPSVIIALAHSQSQNKLAAEQWQPPKIKRKISGWSPSVGDLQVETRPVVNTRKRKPSPRQ